MKKKFTIAVLALVLVFTFTNKADAQTFKDIDGHWAKEYIEWAADNGIFTGYKDGTFKPDKKISRAEFITILSNLKGYDSQDYILESQDVKPSDWFALYLNDFVSLGLIKNGIYFDGDALITRDEAFGLIGQLFPYKMPQENLTFNDSYMVKRTRDICVLKDMGIIMGDTRNNINPSNPLSRAEVATIAYNMNAKNIHIDKLELNYAKENKLFNFDFNVLGLKENYDVGAANELNNAIDDFKQKFFSFMDADINPNPNTNTNTKNNTKNDTGISKRELDQQRKLEEARASKDFVRTYDEALEKFLLALKNREEEFTFSYDPSTYDGKYSIDYQLKLDAKKRPEYFGAIEDGGLIGDITIRLNYKYSITKQELDVYIRQIDDIVRAVEGKSDYDKAKYIHDWIVNNTRYAYDQYLTGEYTLSDGVKVHTPFSIFKHGIAICQGYAETFELLANEVGLNSQIVTGKSYNSNGWGLHAWNLVEIDGRQYHVDTTWDDPVTSIGEDMIRYKYFLIDDREMSKDHSWDESRYPSANSGCLNDGLDINGYGVRNRYYDRYYHDYDDRYRYNDDDGYDWRTYR